jgi:hypothetical protein
MTKALLALACIVCFTIADATVVRSEEKKATNTDDKDLAADLKLLQGSWDQTFGNGGTGNPTLRIVKTIEGNTETRREIDIKTGDVRDEHVADFKLSKSGDVRVFTFHFRGTPESENFAYVYSVDKKTFYDVPGLLHGEYRSYTGTPQMFRWKRVPKKEAEKFKASKPEKVIEENKKQND